MKTPYSCMYVYEDHKLGCIFKSGYAQTQFHTSLEKMPKMHMIKVALVVLVLGYIYSNDQVKGQLSYGF